MKKNLMSVLILALLIVNIVLTVITMVSVTSTNKKTASVVNSIATVLNLELNTSGDDTAEKEVKKKKSGSPGNHRPDKLAKGQIYGGDGVNDQNFPTVGRPDTTAVGQ